MHRSMDGAEKAVKVSDFIIEQILVEMVDMMLVGDWPVNGNPNLLMKCANPALAVIPPRPVVVPQVASGGFRVPSKLDSVELNAL